MQARKPLSSGKWLVLFALSWALLLGLLAAFNIVTDPFGAFGDRFFGWWSYDETNNPRVAKMSYLRAHHDEYDSYIIGCSSTSSYPTEALDRCFDAHFYNLIMYGADMWDVEQMSRYLIEHYTVKNLVVNVYIDNGTQYRVEENRLTHKMPYWVDGSAVDYYRSFLFAAPEYGIAKLRLRRTDGYLQAAHDVFNVTTGAYDKSRRDVEPIGGLADYLAVYDGFTHYDATPRAITETERCMASLAAIRDLCAQRGVRLVVVCAPIYYDYLMNFDRAEVTAFYAALAETTPFWDFSVSSVSREPRYFYDETHFRNAVGDMALARLAGDGTRYVPDDFGVYVTPENVLSHVNTFWNVPLPDEDAYTVRLPILMYHGISDTGDDTVRPARLEEQLRALRDAGYTAVGPDALRDYVYRGKPLPDKPVMLTFDDGYDDNRTLAAPLLARYGMEATEFVIGVSAGKDTYKDTGAPMTPHFTMEQAAELERSGVFTVESHGWNIHEVEGRDAAPIRRGILQREDESEADYIAFLRDDCARMNALLAPLGHGARALAYPYGLHAELSSVLLRECGIDMTFTTAPGVNTLVKGLGQSLWDLHRFAVENDLDGEALVALLEGQ